MGEGAIDLTELVVDLGVGAVEAHGQPRHPGGLELLKLVPRAQRCRGRRDGHAQTDLRSVLGELHDVRALEGVPPGEDEDDGPEAPDVVQHLLGFVGGELVGMTVGLRLGATVLARQVTRLRGLPDDQEGGLVEVGEVRGPSVSSSPTSMRMPSRMATRMCGAAGMALVGMAVAVVHGFPHFSWAPSGT